ncbi:hypothetical protein BD414DRAFT_499741 [Trametes punicea]|nr:hypothetical protein BD414DRAFT_499741 [Trametes punicea]
MSSFSRSRRVHVSHNHREARTPAGPPGPARTPALEIDYQTRPGSSPAGASPHNSELAQARVRFARPAPPKCTAHPPPSSHRTERSRDAEAFYHPLAVGAAVRTSRYEQSGALGRARGSGGPGTQTSQGSASVPNTRTYTGTRSCDERLERGADRHQEPERGAEHCGMWLEARRELAPARICVAPLRRSGIACDKTPTEAESGG